MINLQEFVMSIQEGRPRKNIDGKPAETNGTGGVHGTNEPKDDAAIVEIPKEQLNKNMKRLLMKFRTEEDFFIVGRAGWGKTSIIKKLVDQFHMEIKTVYLDKCVKEDLGGIPVPGKTKTGRGKQEMLMPEWAAEIADEAEKKWLLFFDEMNQADPGVMNALMPIVLEHEICGKKIGPEDKNGKVKQSCFFVGAAGNFEDENDAVNDLSGPLRSRFKPLIVWQCDWNAAFDHLHGQWDDILGKDFINQFDSNRDLFDNPREIEHKIFKFVDKLKKSGNFDEFDAEDYYERLVDIANEDIDRAGEKTLQKLGEYVYDYINGKIEQKAEKAGRSTRNKDMSMVSDITKNTIREGMRLGYVTQKEGKNKKTVKYGISRENIAKAVDMEECNAEMLERIISKFEADGIKFKYETDAEWKKLGYKDPDDEDEA